MFERQMDAYRTQAWELHKRQINAYRKRAERSADERGITGWNKTQYVSMAVWSYSEGIAMMLKLKAEGK